MLALAAITAGLSTPAHALTWPGSAAMDMAPSIISPLPGSDCLLSAVGYLNPPSVGDPGHYTVEADDYWRARGNPATCDAILAYAGSTSPNYVSASSPNGYFAGYNLNVSETSPTTAGSSGSFIVCDRAGGVMKSRQISISRTAALPVTIGPVLSGCTITQQMVLDSVSNLATMTPAPIPVGDPGGYAAKPRLGTVEAESSTLAGGSNAVTFGSGFSGTGWVQGMSIGASVTFAVPHLAFYTPIAIRITAPFNSATVKSCFAIAVNGTTIPDTEARLFGTEQPGGDWTNWSQSAEIFVPGAYSGLLQADTVKITCTGCTSGTNGNGFNVDYLTWYSAT